MNAIQRLGAGLAVLVVSQMFAGCWNSTSSPASESTDKARTTPQAPAAMSAPRDETLAEPRWPQHGFSAQRTSFNPNESKVGGGNVGSLKLVWSKSFRSTIRRTVSVVNGRAYFGLYRGEFYCADAATGEILWEAKEQAKHSGTAVADGVVYSNWENKACAFDAESGEVIWTREAREKESFGLPLLTGDLLLFSGKDRRILQVDRATGDIVGDFPPSFGFSVWQNTIYLARRDAPRLQAIDLESGNVHWEREIDYDEFASNTAVSDGVVVVHSDLGRLYAFDASVTGEDAGRPLWTAPTIKNVAESPQPPAIGYGKVFVGAGNTFFCYSLKPESTTPKPLWTTKTKSDFFGSHPPSIANGVVYSVSGIDEANGYGADNGAILWGYRIAGTSHPLRACITVVDGRLFLPCTFAFRLMVFEPEPDVDTQQVKSD